MTTRIYSTDTDAGTISVIEDKGGKHDVLCQIPVGNAPRGAVKFTKDGRGYVSNCGGDTISELDVFTNRETAQIKVGPAPRGIGIIPGDRFALVSSSGANMVAVVDLKQRKEVHRVAVGRDPRHMAVTKDGHWVYVAVWGSHYVSKISTRAVVEDRCEHFSSEVYEHRRIHVPPGSHPYSVALSPDGLKLYVANTQSRLLSVIDTTKDEVVKEVDLGHKGARAIAVSQDGSIAYVSVEDTSEVAAFDTRSYEIVKRFAVGPGPRGIALDGATIYSAGFARTRGNVEVAQEFLPNSISVITVPEPGKLKAAEVNYVYDIPVGTGPCSVSVLHLDGLSG